MIPCPPGLSVPLHLKTVDSTHSTASAIMLYIAQKDLIIIADIVIIITTALYIVQKCNSQISS